jgi:hypothetical protein
LAFKFVDREIGQIILIGNVMEKQFGRTKVTDLTVFWRVCGLDFLIFFSVQATIFLRQTLMMIK